jgi:hypothetical protein
VKYVALHGASFGRLRFFDIFKSQQAAAQKPHFYAKNDNNLKATS